MEGWQIRWMPRIEHYLQTDIVCADFGEDAAKAQAYWDTVTVGMALYVSVYRGGALVRTKDFRMCKNCQEHLTYCSCGNSEGGLITADKGQILPKQSASMLALLERITNRKKGATK